MRSLTIGTLAALLVVGFASAGQAGVIYASGQLLVPGNPQIPPGNPGHDDSRENYLYAIDTDTGVATPVSPVTTGLPAALAGTRDQRLLGFKNGQPQAVDRPSATQTPIGAANGLSATGFEVLPNGRGLLVPFNAGFQTQQLYEIDTATGAANPISASATEIGDAIDTAAGNPLGTSSPFIISLGAVGNVVYGIDLDTNSLIALDPVAGTASVVGDVGAVGEVGDGIYSGFAALTGVDEDEDGEFDALFGAVNFLTTDTETLRLGGVARFDLTDGSWSLVGENPGVIFFGFGSSPAAVHEPSGLLSLAGGILAVALYRVSRTRRMR